MKTTLLVCLSFTAIAAASRNARAADPTPAAREPGDLWEVTSTMTMEGMNFAMPAQTQRVCAAREWTKPPMADDDKSKCETIDFKNTPAKSTWKVRCAGPPAMTGEGEISRSGPDAYKGWMKVTSSEGVMTMNLSGRRVGDCDAAEQKRQTAKMVAQAEAGQKMAADSQKQACQAPVQALDLRTMTMMASFCTDPAIKTAFCKRLDAADGLELVCERGERDPENGLTAIAAYCGRDPGEIRAGACKDAVAKENFAVIGKCCPDEARALAARECAGRKYTALTGSKYQNFCVQYARDTMAGGENDPSAKPPTDEADADKKEEQPETGKTKKILKGLFKR